MLSPRTVVNVVRAGSSAAVNPRARVLLLKAAVVKVVKAAMAVMGAMDDERRDATATENEVVAADLHAAVRDQRRNASPHYRDIRHVRARVDLEEVRHEREAASPGVTTAAIDQAAAGTTAEDHAPHLEVVGGLN